MTPGLLALMTLAGCKSETGNQAAQTRPPRNLATIADLEKDDNGNVVGISLIMSDVTDEELAGLSKFPALESLQLLE